MDDPLAVKVCDGVMLVEDIETCELVQLTRCTSIATCSTPLPVGLPETFRKLPECGKSISANKLPDKLPGTFRNLPELHAYAQK